MLMVGLAGFEPTTFRPPDERATKLRYSPIRLYRHFLKNEQPESVEVSLKIKTIFIFFLDPVP